MLKLKGTLNFTIQLSYFIDEETETLSMRRKNSIYLPGQCSFWNTTTEDLSWCSYQIYECSSKQPVNGNIFTYQAYKNSEVTPDDSASLPPTSLGTRYFDSFVPSLILLAIHWFNNQVILKYLVTSTTCKALGSAKWKTPIAKAAWERRLRRVKTNHCQKYRGPVQNARVTARQPISITQRMLLVSRE